MIDIRICLLLMAVLLGAVPPGVAAQDAPAPWVTETGAGQFFAVIVSDVDRSTDWYQRVLGLGDIDRLEADDGSYVITIVGNDRFYVELLQLSDAVDVERAMTFFKIGFEVPDLESLADRVESETGERPRVLTFETQGMRIIQIRDPDGNILQPFEKLTE